MPVATLTEHLEIGGLPLATPGWVHRDLGDLYALTGVDYSNAEARHHDGGLPRRGVGRTRPVTIPLVIRGNVDGDGVAHPTSLEGIRANLDTLARNLVTDYGTRQLRHLLADGTVRQAPCQVEGLTVGFQGPHHVNGVLQLLLPGGVLRDATTTVASSASSSTTRTFVVPNPGSALQLASIWTLTGTATSVVLTNQTMDPDAQVTVTAALGSGAVELDTDRWRSVQGATRVPVLHTGHPRWLPLLPGDNTVQVAPSGGTVAVNVAHYAPWR